MPTSKKALVLAVALLEANVVKSASASLVERNSAVIIALKVAVAVGSVVMTIAQESDATKEVVISEAATTVVHATGVTALRLIQTVHAHVVGTVVHEVETEVVLAENQQENATRSTKLSCILGV
jgi:hypothetical protein